MALETTFRQLFGQLKRLKEMLDPLRCLLPDDPLNLEVALVQHLRESVETVSGWLDDCVDQLQAVQDSLSGSGDLNRSRRTLTRCQASFDEAERTFSAELLSYDKMREITGLGARRRGIWLIWSQNVKRDLDTCRYELDLTRKAFTACWQELAEHAGTTNISVQTTNVGQQITAGRSEIGELEIEGVT
jgi:hypothetical protein